MYDTSKVFPKNTWTEGREPKKMSSENDHLSRKFRITNVWAGYALKLLARKNRRKKKMMRRPILVAQKIKETWEVITKKNEKWKQKWKKMKWNGKMKKKKSRHLGVYDWI